MKQLNTIFGTDPYDYSLIDEMRNELDPQHTISYRVLEFKFVHISGREEEFIWSVEDILTKELTND